MPIGKVKVEYGRCVRSLGSGLLSWRQDGAFQAWRKENKNKRIRKEMTIMKKGDWTLQSWRKEIGPCNLGERRWALSLGEIR